MEKKHTLILDKEFTQFCELNNITDIDKQAQETFNRGFSLLKYGEIPNGNKIREIVEVPKETIKEVIVENFNPDGYNIGMNVGAAAGQTILHCHCHMIPRYFGDEKRPKGGIRGIVPGKRGY